MYLCLVSLILYVFRSLSPSATLNISATDNLRTGSIETCGSVGECYLPSAVLKTSKVGPNSFLK